MANQGATQQAHDKASALFEDFANKLRPIQPGRLRLVYELCAGVFLLGYAVWSHHGSSGFDLPFTGCLLIGMFFRDLALRSRLKALLYDMVWHV